MSDLKNVMAECERSSIPPLLYAHMGASGEAFLSGVVRSMLAASRAHERLFFGGVPEIAHYEMEFNVPRGRVDAALFHVDGSATACEIKDGSQGLQSVVAGIGQVMCYATQMGMAKSGLKCVRKALIFSPCQSVADDALVWDSCVMAGVIPVPMAHEASHRAASMSFIKGLLERGS